MPFIKNGALCLILLVGTLFLSAETCLAEGIDSTNNTDLPIGAGGQRAMTICGGGTDCAGAHGAVMIGTTGRAPQATLDVEGTIHASGAVRPGNATMGASCLSTKDGALAYDVEKNTHIYCKEGTWTEMGGEGKVCGAATWIESIAKALSGRTFCTAGINNIPCQNHDIVTKSTSPTNPCTLSCPVGYNLLVLTRYNTGHNASDDTYQGSAVCLKECPEGSRSVGGSCRW